MRPSPFNARRRRVLAALWASLAVLFVPLRAARAQWSTGARPGVDARELNTPKGVIDTILRGATMRHGRVELELPALAENGHLVPLTVRVASPMTGQDYVRTVDLVSGKNPVPHMASFTLGPRAGRAEISTRVRLNGTQRLTAIARMSDGSFWYGSFDVRVTEAACLDGG